MTVDKAGMIELYTFLKEYKLFGFRNTENITDKRKPKGLAVALFVAAVFPIFCKCFSIVFYILLCHIYSFF